jgi:hypothetical protein
VDARLAEWIAQQPRDDGTAATVADVPAADSGLAITDEELAALFVYEWQLDLALASTTGEEEDAAPAAPAPDLPEQTALDADSEFDAVVEEMVADFARQETPVVVAEPTGTFEPYPLCDDLYPGLAYELNRQAEGLDIDAAEVDAPPPGPAPSETAGNQLSTAVRLTREAVFAWINLLQSPALVTISR